MAERQSQQDPRGPSSENEEGQKPHRWENPPKTVESLAREAIHRVAASKAGGDDAPIEPAANVLLQDFISALLKGDADFGLALIEGYRRKGRSYRFIAETLFGEAARKLGAEWEPPTVKLIREVRRARSRTVIGVGSCKLELDRDRTEDLMRHV